MPTLRQKQSEFARDVARLIQKADELGYEVTLGEVERPRWVAMVNEHFGRGIAHSLHTIRLAIDLNLFRDGRYLRKSEDYRELGEYWEALRPGNCWGGHFDDGNHFSREHNGVR